MNRCGRRRCSLGIRASGLLRICCGLHRLLRLRLLRLLRSVLNLNHLSIGTSDRENLGLLNGLWLRLGLLWWLLDNYLLTIGRGH